MELDCSIKSDNNIYLWILNQVQDDIRLLDPRVIHPSQCYGERKPEDDKRGTIVKFVNWQDFADLFERGVLIVR